MPDTVSAGHADGMIGARTASDDSARLSITPAQSPLLTFRRQIWVVIAGAVAATVIVLRPMGTGVGSQARAGQTALLLSTAVAAGLLAVIARRPDGWRGTRLMAWGMMLSAIFQTVVWVLAIGASGPVHANANAAAAATLLAVMLGVVVIDFEDHLRSRRADVISDVALVAALLGGIAYLALGAPSMHPTVGNSSALSAIVALAAVLVLSGWCVLVLWVASPLHYGLAGTAWALGLGALWLDADRTQLFHTGSQGPALVCSFAVLGLTALMAAAPALRQSRPSSTREQWWLRPSLLTVCLGGACLTLGFALTSHSIASASRLQAGLLLGVVAVLVAIRSFMAQGATSKATTQLARALDEREDALESVRRAGAEAAASESRLRLLFDAAADGVVELNGTGRILRANDAFCQMMQLGIDQVLGRQWRDVTGHAPVSENETEAPMADLPATGQGELTIEGRTVYVESRSSQLPGDPPGMLLFIRDVTSTRVADQTIRTLFQFLQDRDEDRTRLLRRGNSTIEAERNRIARDIHDGPIQGISAASLSLEAVKMLLSAGEADKAEAMLAEVRAELSDEAESLRRLMSNLRPPLLDERGLIPAVRELSLRAEKDLGVSVSVDGAADQSVPEEVEVLAYRVVQEALTNVGKHAHASTVEVRIRCSGGILDVEVGDDGSGFDPTKARDFLRKGKVGLASMRERTELGGGTFTVRSQPGRGTTVTASLPYELLDPMKAHPRPHDLAGGLGLSG
jgi:PAS domain S-box-containing protein